MTGLVEVNSHVCEVGDGDLGAGHDDSSSTDHGDIPTKGDTGSRAWFWEG